MHGFCVNKIYLGPGPCIINPLENTEKVN